MRSSLAERNKFSRVRFGVLAAAAVGCLFCWEGCAGGGGPSVLLTLRDVPAGVEGGGGDAGAKGAFSVAVVDVPPALDRSDFVAATGPTTLKEEKAQWEGPFADLVRRALTRDLAERLNGATVLAPGEPAPRGVREVHVAVQSFQPDASGTVTLEADWWVSEPGAGSGTARPNHFRVAVPGGKTPATEAQTMSDALGRLADAVAEHLAQVPG